MERQKPPVIAQQIDIKNCSNGRGEIVEVDPLPLVDVSMNPSSGHSVRKQAHAQIEAVQFYTPSSAEQSMDQFDVPSYLADNPLFKNFAQKFITPFAGNAARSDTRIRVFSNGDLPYAAAAPKNEQGQKNPHKIAFEQQSNALVASYVKDFIGPDGRIIEAKKQEWENLQVIAPNLVDILTDRTYHTALVQRDHALNITAAALHMATHPDAQLTFRIGIGGSEDDATNALLPAYCLPAIQTAEKVKEFYANRAKRKNISGKAVQEKIGQFQDELGLPLTPKEVEVYFAKAKTDAVINSMPGIKKRYGIPDNPVKIEFVFAPESAIGANGMDPEKVQARTAENMQFLKDYVATYHPSLVDDSVYMDDKPWTLPTPEDLTIYEAKGQKVPLDRYYLQAEREYLASLLREGRATSETINQTMIKLEERGAAHGDAQGIEMADEYAAIHPQVFGDRLNIPYISYLNGQIHNPELLITGGGDTERHFIVMREYLSSNANPAGFAQFLDAKIQSMKDGESNQITIKQYERIRQILPRWDRLVEHKRETSYTNRDASPVTTADFPRHIAPETGHTGKDKPRYYNDDEFDRAAGTDIDEYIVFLDNADRQLKSQDRATRQENKLTQVAIESRMYDAKAMRDDMQRANPGKTA